MATLAIMAGGALVNALAFSGTNFIFNRLSDRSEETKRHNAAMERLSLAKKKDFQERQQRLDYINKSLQQQNHSIKTFKNLGIAMRQYSIIFKKTLTPLKKPQFSDFYQPSEDQKDSEIAFVIGGMSILGIVVYKYL